MMDGLGSNQPPVFAFHYMMIENSLLISVMNFPREEKVKEDADADANADAEET